jgi:hypothetical protein
MKKLSLFLIMSVGIVNLKAQVISGPSEVNLNDTVTFINTNGPGSGYTEYYWIAEDGTLIGECEDSLEYVWSGNGFFNVGLWLEDTYLGTDELIDELEVVVGDPPIIEYSYDNAGNRVSREIVYYSELDEGLKSMKTQTPPKKDEEIQPEELMNLYPNPANHSVNIVVSPEVLEMENKRIIIYDFQGRVIKQMIPQGLVTEMEVSDMRSGTYIVKVLYGSKSKDWKLIKQ